MFNIFSHQWYKIRSDLWSLNSSLVCIQSPSFLIWWWLGRNFAMGIGRRSRRNTALSMRESCFCSVSHQHILSLYYMILLRCRWSIRGEAFLYNFIFCFKPGYLHEFCFRINVVNQIHGVPVDWALGAFIVQTTLNRTEYWLISFISKQLWLFWLGTNFLDYNCGCIYSILHPEVEKASAEDDLRHGERPVHHNQGQPMSFARRRWEWVNLLQRSTSDRECRFS